MGPGTSAGTANKGPIKPSFNPQAVPSIKPSYRPVSPVDDGTACNGVSSNITSCVTTNLAKPYCWSHVNDVVLHCYHKTGVSTWTYHES